MFAHSLLSGALILLPIAITVGIYVGIESQKIFNGGFDGSYGVPGSGNSNPDRNVVETSMYCQKLIGIRPAGSRFTCELSSSQRPFLSALQLVPAVVAISTASQFFFSAKPNALIGVQFGHATFFRCLRKLTTCNPWLSSSRIYPLTPLPNPL
jgi:hypothetical protein